RRAPRKTRRHDDTKHYLNWDPADPGAWLSSTSYFVISWRLLARVYLRANAIRCHPSGRTHARGNALNVPTKSVLKAVPFHPLCRRDLTGNRSGTIRTSENGVSRFRNSAMLNVRRTGASSCSSSTFISFDRAFSQDTRL